MTMGPAMSSRRSAWRRRSRRLPSTPLGYAVADPPAIEQIPTGLTIPDDAVDKLVDMGQGLVRNSETLAQFHKNPEGPPQQVSGGE